MTRLGRKNRPFYRIVATDARAPRDGKYIEELGLYDPLIPNKDERVRLKPSRIKYWLSVGALPSENVAVFLKKYMEKFEKLEAEAAAAATEAAAEAPAT
jgi:small subunit ribosomal protein S16